MTIAGVGAEVAPLSLQQEFLRLFDQGDDTGPFGPRYVITDGWRVRGRVDVAALRRALDDVCARHESLRTVISRGAAEPAQRVLPPASVELLVHDLPGVPAAERATRAEELVNEAEARPFPVTDLPLLRAVLGRFDDRDAVLVLTTHHSAADAWSMQVIVREVAACLAARSAGREPELPEAAQYREYAARQRENADGPAVAAAREYWRTTLRGARILVQPTDGPPSGPPTTGWHRFLTSSQVRANTVRLAAEKRSSPFMVLLAAFTVLVNRQSGATDIVVPTFAPGRGDRQFENTVGSFFNFVPLRVDLVGCRTFSDVVGRVRATCIGAYAHELPLVQVLAEAPELMASAMAPGVAPCLFQVIQPPFMLEGERIGELAYEAIWRREISQPIGSDIPDGMLWSVHVGPSDDLVGAIGFSSHLYRTSTVDGLAQRFVALLGELVARPDDQLDRI
ncbi:condensation domain-containing protein [Micromonospora sp. NPDC050980]|uniref:condensation domain-containing protein n=1 Tax=Micromonospora sp. NPDC050980 TaxID=3155161 RepID=UPI0033F4C46F